MNERDVKAGFAIAVRQRRKQLGLSQEKLAERANLHRTYISDVERGARNLSLDSITRLASALQVSISALFFKREQQSEPGDGIPSPFDQRQAVDILLVEDDPNDIELTLAAFRRSRFANLVHVVRDGAEALDYVLGRGIGGGQLSHPPPQIILLDLNLPKVSGLEVLRRIRTDAASRQIPVVILTSSQREMDITACRRLGADTYIVKPVDFQRLSEITPQLSMNWMLLRPESQLDT
ncbi:MAG: response regulator [Verrucomicrobia bacterium]|nr:response regulator [Verrucomicrobiota bacterium]